MGKIGFNCQLFLSEIGLTTDSSHSTWFQKTVRFSRSKLKSVLHEEDLAQHVLFDTGRRRARLSILKKKQRNQNQVKMIRINSFFLRQRSYHFRRNWSYISFPFPFKSSYVFPRPFETPKNGQIPFLFLGTHTRFVTTKRIMVTPPLTTSFMIYEFHSNRNTCPTKTEFGTCYPLAQQAKIYLRGKDNSFGST